MSMFELHIPSYSEHVQRKADFYDKLWKERKKHTRFYEDAMLRLEAVRVPDWLDWRYASACKEKLEVLTGLKYRWVYPFDDCGPYENIYEARLVQMDGDELCEAAQNSVYEAIHKHVSEESYDEELPF